MLDGGLFLAARSCQRTTFGRHHFWHDTPSHLWQTKLSLCMASRNQLRYQPRPRPRCAQAIAQDDTPRHQIPSDKDNQTRSADQRDYDFVEQPSQDFFCPVTLEFLLDPQLTSCCGHHLSLEASSRLQREGKACPLCSETGWSTVLDKFHRRRVHELRVRCPHKGSGCDWVGEVNSVERHAGCCPKRAWECQYCGLKCTYGEGEGEHWPTCSNFPEPCPNGCEVGSVERCNVEQHRSVCSLEPMCCEMREFGCSAVVPRKDLATHMRKSELQHLTGMAVLNLQLTRQLQQDLAEKDKKIAQLQREMTEQRQLQTEVRRELTEMRGQIQHIEGHIAGLCTGYTLCKVFRFHQYSQHKGTGWNKHFYSDQFYSHQHGYKFKLSIVYYSRDIGAFLYLLTGEYDDQLPWPVNVTVLLELLNQAGDHHLVEWTGTWKWGKDKRNKHEAIAQSLMQYSDLEKRGDGAQYMMNDCLKFRLHLTIQTV